jgi:hypothetical protein
MNNLSKSLVVALVHIAIVLSLGGKLLYDRATCPRVWVPTASVDPNMPIRGRYVTLSLQVHAVDYQEPARSPSAPRYPQSYGPTYVGLSVESKQLVARHSDKTTGMTISAWNRQPAQAGNDVFILWPPVDFFIPEHADFPLVSRRAGEEMWAEVTVPRKGPPRPIQLAIKRGTEWIPLSYR